MKKLKAVICCVNSKYIHSSLAPWCLYAGVKQYANSDINAVVVEGTINENIDCIYQRIITCNPDVVSFCCYIWNINTVIKLCKMVKDFSSNIKIVLGGPEVSYNAKSVLTNYSFVDFIISGEGEKSFPLLLNSLLENNDDFNISGLCYKSDDKYIISPPAIECGDPVSPYCEEYFNNLNGRIAYIETSRGCPYSCAFCLSGRCGKARFFDINRAKKEIIMLANSGTQTVKFVDRTFNANKSRAKEIFKFIISNYKVKIPVGVCFHFEIAGDILDEETISILSSAPVGLIQLEIGMQSFNEKTLEYINRKTNTKKLINNILQLTKLHNMHIHIDLIAGLPFEDINSFKESFNIGFNLNSNMLQLGFLKLLHGALMREDSQKYPCEYSLNPPYEVVSTPWLSKEDLKRLHNLEDTLDRVYNSGRFKQTVKYIIETSKISPFEFFDNFAKFILEDEICKISLDKYTELFWNYANTFNNIDKAVLRDTMVCDRLSSNASGKIPKILQIQDDNLKQYKVALEKLIPQEKNTLRGIAILYTQNCVVYVDYIKKNNSMEEYKLKYINLSEIQDFIYKAIDNK